MKIRVLRSKISKKRYQKFEFPKYTLKEITQASDPASAPPIPTLKLERAPVVYTETAVVGSYAIKNFKEITIRMRSNPDKFGGCLNKLITLYSDTALSDGGVVGKFIGTGAFFAFKCGSKPEESIQKAIIAALRMRYVLNKLNREWDFYRDDAWQVGFGMDFGTVEFHEHKDDYVHYTTLSGRPGTIALGIGQSAGSSQILLTESMYLKFPFLETVFDLKPPRHVPVKGEDFVSKIREVTGMVGPQAKKIYEVFV